MHTILHTDVAPIDLFSLFLASFLRSLKTLALLKTCAFLATGLRLETVGFLGFLAIAQVLKSILDTSTYLRTRQP